MKKRARRIGPTAVLPFALEAGRFGESLTDQLERKLEEAIGTGLLEAGRPLPSREKMAEALGVSVFVIRAACGRLVRSGLLIGRPRIGFVVQRPDGRRRSAFVLHVTSDCPSYSSDVASQEYERQFRAAGWRYRRIAASLELGERKLRVFLEEALQERPDVILIGGMCRELLSRMDALIDSGIPYVACGAATPVRGNCIGRTELDCRQAVAEFAADCRKRRLRSVCQFDFGADTYLDATAALETAGIRTERVSVLPSERAGGLDGVVRLARRKMTELLARGRLPDLFLFTDDYLAMGGLATMLERGLRIPRDVAAVSYVNRGSGFAFSSTYACIEYDPRHFARGMAKRILHWHRTGRAIGLVQRALCYRRGATLPVF